MCDIKPGVMVVAKDSKTASLGIGHVQDVRGNQAKVEFRPTIFSEPPYLTVSRVIECEKLQILKSPVERLQDQEYDDLLKFELRQLATHLLVCNRDGQLSNARTDLLPHQITIAHDVVSNPRRRFLIADEVGLGKTIEAGMVLYALGQRGQMNRVLIITPAGLTLQWQEELKEKFDMDFAVYGQDVMGVLAFDQNDHMIASIDTLKLDRPRKKGELAGHKTLVLGARDWDVLIFDEAHKLSAKTWSAQKTEKTLNFRLAEDLEVRCEALLLLTATPHQGDESKFQNLVGLLHEHIVFEQWDTLFETGVQYTDLILRNRKSTVTDADGNPIFKGMTISPVRVNLLNTGEKKFHKALVEYLREGYGYAEQDPGDKQHKAIGFVMTTFQKLAASSTRAIKKALEKRRDNLLREAENGAEAEQGPYDARYQGEIEVCEAAKVVDPFVETEVEMLNELINMRVPKDGKQAELFKAIDSVSRDVSNQRVLIFTEYLETQKFIREILEERYGTDCTVFIKGGMSLWDKKKSQEAFRDNPRARFLVSTEAGGEGINLQFAHVMINYDLPWNPFRLAQRYGRLYRYGQDEVVQAFNFQNAGTIEDKVSQYLERKTATAANRLSQITGESVEEIEEGLLGLFDEFIDYDKVYRDGLAKGDLKPSQKAVDEGVVKAQKAYEIAYHSLFSKDISPFNPDRFKHEIESPLTLKDVEQFVRAFVGRHGRKFLRLKEETYEFLLPGCLSDLKGLKKRYENVTFDRRSAIRQSHLDFMALGNAFVDSAINYCGQPSSGGFAAVRVIEAGEHAGKHGVHFNFLVKRTKRTDESESIFFDLVSVFVEPDGTVDAKAGKVALRAWGEQPKSMSKFDFLTTLDIEALEQKAREAVLQRYPEEALWDEDISVLNVAGVAFV